MRVSQLNGCAFCVDLNSATLMKRGASAEKVEALAQWRERGLFDAREQAALPAPLLDFLNACLSAWVFFDTGQSTAALYARQSI